jgi:hypothetical protein
LDEEKLTERYLSAFYFYKEGGAFMKKLMMILLLTFAITLFSGNIVEVSASSQIENFYNMTSGNMVETDSYGTTTYGKYSWVITDIDEHGENGCYYTANTYIKIRQRSTAGATGATDIIYPDFIYQNDEHYHSTYYGDEDIYLEITIVNINGVCDLEISFDPDA